MTEETLGRRVSAQRKKLGLTQDALAEKLGVTAQAVSKWEKDQSCPDISMLPKLAKLFDCTTDALLGVERKQEPPTPVLPAPEEPQPPGQGSRLGVTAAIWLLLNAGIWIVNEIVYIAPLDPWTMLLPTGMIVFGFFGLLRGFSFSKLGCVLFGVYLSWMVLCQPPERLDETILYGIFVAILALELLMASLPGRRQTDEKADK